MQIDTIRVVGGITAKTTRKITLDHNLVKHRTEKHSAFISRIIRIGW